MNETLPALSRVLSGETLSVPPVWMMRQAGRYLPEYRALRAKFPDFVAFCMHPEAAAEATLQPIRRFDMDAAVIFSDILILPRAMGCALAFKEQEGPSLTAPEGGLLPADPALLEPVYEALRGVRRELVPEKSLIGFCGAPWTLYLYLTAVHGEKEFVSGRKRAASDPAAAEALIRLLEEAAVDHAAAQVRAGADVIQFFDSWAGLCPPFLRERLITEPAARMTAALRRKEPSARIIVFAKGLGAAAAEYAAAVRPDALSVEPGASLAALSAARPGLALQGNVDPLTLFAGEAVIREEARACLRVMAGKPYIAGLGHGVLPGTDPESVGLLREAFRA